MKVSSVQFFLALAGLLLGVRGNCESAEFAWSVAGELERVTGPEDLSGICRRSGDQYWLVGDNAGELHLARLAIDPVTGVPRDFAIKDTFAIEGADDLEGVAGDPLAGTVWVSDETGPAIFEYDSASNRVVSRVAVPSVFGSVRKNRGFESLAVSPDGLSLWACNENELGVDDDGAVESGEFVRLVKFVRESRQAKWVAAGQWACPLLNRSGPPQPKKSKGAKGGKARGEKKSKAPKVRNGVADLCVLDDGRLLLLEREKTKLKKEQSFRLALYELDVSEADDVSARPTLAGVSVRPVAKRLVYAAATGTAMYEGLSQGPTLSDGSRTLVLVSDGEKGAAKRLLVLKAVR